MQSGPGFVPTFLYYFAGTTLITVFVLSRGSASIDQVQLLNNPFQIGIPLGLIVGGIGAYFNQHEQINFPIKNRGADWQRLNQTLTQMGYTEIAEIDQTKIYERSFPSNLFAGKLLVYSNDSTIQISGRASRVRALKKLVDLDSTHR